MGDGEEGSAGIRIQGIGQVVSNNYFQNLGIYGLGMMDGTPDDLYVRVENAYIHFNAFINCENTFSIGLNHSKHPNGTPPKDCTIEGNVFYSDSESDESFIRFVQEDQPENWTWKDNIAFGQSFPKIEGIQNLNPHFFKEELYLPTDKTPEIKVKSELRKVGAIQFPINEKTIQPLKAKMVGADF